jgi:hypothetical protein
MGLCQFVVACSQVADEGEDMSMQRTAAIVLIVLNKQSPTADKG